MSAGEETEAVAEETVEPEPRGMSDRTAKIILSVVGLGAAWGIVAAAPWLAYVVVGILLDRAWQKVRRWLARRQESSDETAADADEVTMEDVVETLHEVANPNVFLADFAAAFDLDTTAARTLLEGHAIRVRRAVRNGNTTGVGVHRDDVPPLPQPLPEGAETSVDLHNQRPTAEPIGLAGWVLKDGSEASRRHRLR